MRWRNALVAASSCALLLAGCGGGETRQQRPAPRPRLPHAVAQQLAAQADRIGERLAANDRCGAVADASRLQSQVIDAINAHRVPRRLQEPLQSAVNSLAARVGACVDERKPEHKEKPKHEKKGKHEKD
jgi:hypothetical protein